MNGINVVRKGQRYAQIFRSSSHAQVWTVERVFYDLVRVPHAFLINEQEHTSTKTISCSTLADGMQYHSVGNSRLSV